MDEIENVVNEVVPLADSVDYTSLLEYLCECQTTIIHNLQDVQMMFFVCVCVLLIVVGVLLACIVSNTFRG